MTSPRLSLLFAAALCACPGVPPPCDGPCDAGLTLDCPVGQMPSSSGCQPAGWADCDGGFTASASGWGCVGVLPAAPCPLGSAARLGFADCQPVGDCTAPFPPADATHFVDPRFTAAQLDATHFNSLVNAMAAIDGGAVVAIEQGTYLESLALTQPVHLVGRCPAQVRISSLSQRYTAIGVKGVTGVEVSGVTIDSHLYAALVDQGGSLLIRDSILDSNLSLGVYVSDPGSLVRLERVVVSGTRVGTNGGWGLLVDLGARAEVVDSAVVGNAVSGGVVRGAGSTLLLQGSVVAGNRLDAGVQGAAGLLISRGGHLEAQRVVFQGNGEAGLIVAATDPAGQPSVAALSDVEVRDGQPTLATYPGPSGDPQYMGRGLVAQQGGQLQVVRCSLTANHELGLAVSGSGTRASLSFCSIEGTLPNVAGILGRGVAVFGGGTAALDHAALIGNHEVGLDVTGAGSQGTLSQSLVLGTVAEASGQLAAIGLLAAEGGRVDVLGSAVVSTEGIGLTVSNATATVSQAVVARNQVGVQAQGGVNLSEVAALPAQVEPLACLVTSDTAFLENAQKVGTGVVPLPSPVSAPPR